MCQLLDKKPVEGIVWTVKQEELCEVYVLSTQVPITEVSGISVPLQEFKQIGNTSTTCKQLTLIVPCWSF